MTTLWIRSLAVCVLTAAPALLAQRNTPTELKRIAIGGTLSFLPMDLIKGGTTETTVNPTVTLTSTAEGKSSWFSGGPIVEFRFTPRITVASGFLIRGAKYRLTNDTYTGTDNADTTTDEREKSTTVEETKMRYWDIPVLIRRYNTRTDDTRYRWFYEAGPTLRFATGVRTSIQTTDADFNVTCCNETPATLAHKNAFGITAGAGIRLVDDFGFQVTPEVRYTRWLTSNVANNAARSNRDQIEIGLSITF